jgi:hypothetical protein
MSTQYEACRYGMKCYRRNPVHFNEFTHPAGYNYPPGCAPLVIAPSPAGMLYTHMPCLLLCAIINTFECVEIVGKVEKKIASGTLAERIDRFNPEAIPDWRNAPANSPMLVSARRIALLSHLFKRLDNHTPTTDGSRPVEAHQQNSWWWRPPAAATAGASESKKRKVGNTEPGDSTWLSSTTTATPRGGWVTAVGSDVWVNIMTYATLSEACAAMSSCRLLARAARADQLWRSAALLLPAVGRDIAAVTTTRARRR